MGIENTQVNEVLQQSVGVHVLYCTDEQEKYVENAISFIIAGAEQGDYVFFVENARILPVIQQRIDKLLTQEQLAKVQFMNNFTFYWRNGNFHPPTILAYFSELIAPILEQDASFRTWGHIEWGEEEGIIQDIKEFEEGIDHIVPDKKAISVCAYDNSRVSVEFKELLLSCHGYLMTDDGITLIVR